jgi:hypothetical protein
MPAGIGLAYIEPARRLLASGLSIAVSQPSKPGRFSQNFILFDSNGQWHDQYGHSGQWKHQGGPNSKRLLTNTADIFTWAPIIPTPTVFLRVMHEPLCAGKL